MKLGIVVLVNVCAGLLLTCGKDNNSTNPTIEPQVPTEGLMAYYPFNNGADDGSGNNNDGTLLGGATASGYLTIGPNAADALSVPRRVLDGLGDFTVSAWLRIGRAGNPYNNCWVSCSNGIDHNFLLIWYDNLPSQWRMFIEGIGYSIATDIQMKDLKWHHVTIMRSGALARLFIDGSELGSSFSVSSAALEVTTNGLIIGQDQDSVGGGFDVVQSWAGDMDNLRCYDRALSEAEVQQLANEAHSN